MFFVHTKRKAGVFKFLRLEESFRKALRPHYPEEILKRRFPYENISNVLRPHCAGEMSKLNNHHIDYRDAIVFESFVFKMFSVYTKTKSRRFQIPPV